MEILLRIFMFILMMLLINTRHFIDIFFFEHRESKAWYIVINMIGIIVFFYMIFIYQGGLRW